MIFDIFLNNIVSFRVDVKAPDDMRKNDMRETLKETLRNLHDQGIKPVRFQRVHYAHPIKTFLRSTTLPPIQDGVSGNENCRNCDQKTKNDYDGLRERVSSNVPFPIPILLQEVSLKEALEGLGEKFHEPE